jgi:putative endonuclease
MAQSSSSLDPRSSRRASLDFGVQSEDRAKEWFLANRRARCLVQNFRCKAGELDLVFEEQVGRFLEVAVELVIVEVKARSPGAPVQGVDSITWRKKQRLRRAGEVFLLSYRGKARSIRFDLLAWDGSDWEHRPRFFHFDDSLR